MAEMKIGVLSHEKPATRQIGVRTRALHGEGEERALSALHDESEDCSMRAGCFLHTLVFFRAFVWDLLAQRDCNPSNVGFWTLVFPSRFSLPLERLLPSHWRRTLRYFSLWNQAAERSIA